MRGTAIGVRYIDGRGYYTVSEVAQAAGVSAQTVRVWERHGTVRSRRTPGGHRLFDADARRAVIDRAATQRREAAVEVAVPDPAAQVTDWELASTGARVRAARERARLTQQSVADSAGISRSLLSAIERGESGVSMTVFSRIAVALGIPMSEFAPPMPVTQRLLRAAHRPRTVLGSGVTWEELATAGHTMAPAVMYAEPGASSGGAITVVLENFITVLDGQLSFHLTYTGEDVELSAGDALMIPAGHSYSWINTGHTVARSLWVEQLEDPGRPSRPDQAPRERQG